MRELTKTAIDRLGDRLRIGPVSNEDLELLDRYRRSFSIPFGIVVGKIRKELSVDPTGRPAKSTRSIIEKVRRETVRLSQMQDIAGCRLLVTDIAGQERFSAKLRDLFPGATVIDRRTKPSYGYRAIHVVARQSGKPIEIQVRTSLQHLWAELSEKGADLFDPSVKYGGGPRWVRLVFSLASKMVRELEQTEDQTRHVEGLARWRKALANKLIQVQQENLRINLELLEWWLTRFGKGKRDK